MKIFLMLLLTSLLFLVGCHSSASFDPKTGEFKYDRWGDQALNGVDITIDPNGYTHIVIEKQKSEGDFGTNITNAFQTMFEYGYKAGVSSVTP